jgi:hypothetical protein
MQGEAERALPRRLPVAADKCLAKSAFSTGNLVKGGATLKRESQAKRNFLFGFAVTY